jgi:hypothetical protein
MFVNAGANVAGRIEAVTEMVLTGQAGRQAGTENYILLPILILICKLLLNL